MNQPMKSVALLSSDLSPLHCYIILVHILTYPLICWRFVFIFPLENQLLENLHLVIFLGAILGQIQVFPHDISICHPSAVKLPWPRELCETARMRFFLNAKNMKHLEINRFLETMALEATIFWPEGATAARRVYGRAGVFRMFFF